MEDFIEVKANALGGLRLSFRSPLFRNLVAGLPALWSLLADLKPDSESRASKRFYGNPYAENAGEDFWDELVVPELQGELRGDRDRVFREIESWVALGDGIAGEDQDLTINRDALGAWIGVLGQVRLMISEETGISEAELANAELTDRRRALALGQWVYGALLELLMPYWE